MYHLRDTKGLCGRYIGELQMGGSVKISARQLLEFLAGKQSIEDFTKDLASDRLPNPFHQMLEQGRLISSVTIEHHPENDDDTAIIEFGPPDPAVSPFRIKGNLTKSSSAEPGASSK